MTLPGLQPATPQQEVQAARLAPQPLLQTRQKTGSVLTLPPTIHKNKVLSLSALRKGKPILAPHAAKKASDETGQLKAGSQPKPEGKPAVASPASRQLITPIRAIKSTPVLQRKPMPDNEGFMYQTENQDLPLASQSTGPQLGTASQNQTGFTPSSDRKVSPQQPTPPKPPEHSSGYVNPFTEEPRPEMPLRTPPRSSILESPSQPGQESSYLSGALLEESQATDSGESKIFQTEEQKRANLQDLARKVYPEIIRMLNVETEWLGRRL